MRSSRIPLSLLQLLRFIAVFALALVVALGCGKTLSDSSGEEVDFGVRPEPSVHDPTDVVVDDAGIIYLLTPHLGLVARFDAATGEALHAIEVDADPKKLTYSSSHGCLYLGYEDGRITKVDLDGAPFEEEPFLSLARPVVGLEGAGQFLYAVLPEDERQNTFDHYIFDSAATLMSERRARMSPRDYEWNEAKHHLYSFSHNSGRDGVIWMQVDPATGELTWERSSAAYNAFNEDDLPLRVSADGTLVILGSGLILDGLTGQLIDKVRRGLVDIAILPDGSFVTIEVGSRFRTLIRQWGADRTLYAEHYMDEYPVRMVATPFGLLVIGKAEGIPTFRGYELDPDGDDDGVPNEDDVYPLDPAASVDSDGDGYPDDWNPGKRKRDSTTDLELDAFPNDFACQLEEQGVGGICDFRLVVSPDDDPLCDTDRKAPNRRRNGYGDLEYALDLIPLCDGWVIVSQQEPRGFSFYNAVDDRMARFFPLPLIPRHMALDAESKLLYVVYSGSNEGGVVFDLVSEEFSPIEGNLRADDIAVVPGEGLVIINPYTISRAGELFWLPVGESTPLGPWPFTARGIEVDPVNGDIFGIAEDGYHLDRYSFDETTGPTLLESTEIEWAWDLEVSPDGSLVVPIGSWDLGDEWAVSGFDGADISSPLGPWIVDSSLIKAIGFDLTSERMLTYSGRFALVFDTTTYEELSRFRGSACGTDIDAAGFSRGGDIAFTLYSCHRGRESWIHWFEPDEHDPWPR
ncbi:MAG: hypothetical protein GY944_00460 [bacterium]|nr:hypothetical protein [bacterium]